MATDDTLSALFQLSRPTNPEVTESGFILTQQEVRSESGFEIPGAEPLIERILEEARPREINLLLEKFGPFDQYSPGEIVAQLGYKIFISVWTGDEKPIGDFDLVRQMELDIIGKSEFANPDEYVMWRDPESDDVYQIGKVHEGANEQPLDQLTFHLLSQSFTADPTETRASDIIRQLLEQARAAEVNLYSQGASLEFGYGVLVLQEGSEVILHDNEVQDLQSQFQQEHGSRRNLKWPLILGIAIFALVVGIIVTTGLRGDKPSRPQHEQLR